MSEFCQKVIVPVEYGPPSNRKFKLKYDDVQEVLKYRPDTWATCQVKKSDATLCYFSRLLWSRCLWFSKIWSGRCVWVYGVGDLHFVVFGWFILVSALNHGGGLKSADAVCVCVYYAVWAGSRMLLLFMGHRVSLIELSPIVHYGGVSLCTGLSLPVIGRSLAWLGCGYSP